MMSCLEKILLVLALLLVIGVAAILLMPDESGQGGFGSLSSTIDKISELLMRMLDRIASKMASWAGRVQAWFSQATSSWVGVGEQGNPVDSAVQPVGSFGEESKDEFGKPLEGLQP